MSLYTRLFNWWAVRRQVREADDFLGRLKSMNSDELGIPLLASLEVAAMVRDEKGLDLFDPFRAITQDPALPFYMHQLIAELRKMGRQPLVGGPMLWVHTLRATVNHRVRQMARDMWCEINRGAPYAESARSDLMTLYQMWPSLDRLGDTPKGMEASR